MTWIALAPGDVIEDLYETTGMSAKITCGENEYMITNGNLVEGATRAKVCRLAGGGNATVEINVDNGIVIGIRVTANL